MNVKRYFTTTNFLKWWKASEDPTLGEVYAEREQEIIRRANPAGKVILDAGSGKGDFTIDLLKNAAEFVIGLDVSHSLCDFARRQIRQQDLGGQKVDFLVADIERIPLRNESFDVAICTDTLVHLPNPIVALSELRRVAKENGTVIVHVTSANPLRQLIYNKGTYNKAIRFSYHCFSVSCRYLLGNRIFWELLRKASPYLVPWTPYTRREFLEFLAEANLSLKWFITYRLKSYAPGAYVAGCTREKPSESPVFVVRDQTVS